MTISSSDNRASFAGSGGTGPFSYPYPAYDQASLKAVKINESTGVVTTLTYSTDYTVTQLGTNPTGKSGATVNTTAAVAVGESLTLYYDETPIQSVSVTANSVTPAATKELVWDKLTRFIQRLKDLAGRSVRLNDATADTFDATLPADIADNAGKVISVNSSGNGFVMGSATGTSALQVVSDLDNALNSGTTPIPDDDTIPTSSEGEEVMAVSITPVSTTSKLVVMACVVGATESAVAAIAALFIDSETSARAVAAHESEAGDKLTTLSILYTMTSPGKVATTVKVRAGAGSGNYHFNGTSGGRKFGGVAGSSLVVMEIE